MTLRVGFDARLIDWPGIGRYIELLLTGLRDRTDVSIVAYLNEGQIPLLPTGTRHEVVAEAPFSIGEQLMWPQVVRRDRLDVLHAPHFNVPLLAQVPVVVTVHDAAPLRYPPDGLRGFPRRVYANLFYRLVAGKATRVITVSEFAKGDLRALTSIPAKRVVAIHNALHPNFFDLAAQNGVRAESGADPYVLYVGTNKPWKNVGVALRGAALAAARVPGLRFVFAGKQASNQGPLEGALRAAGRELPVEVTGIVSEERLIQLYQAAIAVLCPSLYEGFGLTGLEAMACGTPVIHSGRASLEEVLGQAGMVASAESPEEWARAIVTMAEDARVRRDYVERGRRRAREFTLARMVAATAEVYREASVRGNTRI